MNIYKRLRLFFPDLPELPDPGSPEVETWEPDSPAELEPIERRNVWHRIEPEEFRGRLIRMWKRHMYDQVKAERDALDARKAANRHPPRNCSRENNTVYWDAPNEGEAPAWYWVEEQRNGSWTRLQPEIMPSQTLMRHLYGDGPARVAAYYPNEPQKYGWGFRYGPLLERPAMTDERMARIVAACKSYTGPRLRRSGAPYVVYLRKHAGMPSISSRERHKAHRLATKEQ